MSCGNQKKCYRQGDIQSWLFSKPSMTVISLNIEGLSSAKEDLIAKMCFKHKCTVLCLQETHRRPQSHRPKVILEALFSHQCTNHQQHPSSSHLCLNHTRTGLSLEILTAITPNGDTFQQTKMATPLNNRQ